MHLLVSVHDYLTVNDQRCAFATSLLCFFAAHVACECRLPFGARGGSVRLVLVLIEVRCRESCTVGRWLDGRILVAGAVIHAAPDNRRGKGARACAAAGDILRRGARVVNVEHDRRRLAGRQLALAPPGGAQLVLAPSPRAALG